MDNLTKNNHVSGQLDARIGQGDVVEICIVSPMKVQNSLLVTCLEKAIGVPCREVESPAKIPPEGERQLEGRRLVLLDCISNDVTRSLTILSGDVLVCFFNLQPNCGYEEECLSKGVKGFFYLGDSIEQLLNGIKAILEGEMWLSRKLMSRYIQNSQKERFSTMARAGLRLTHREKEILRLIAEGATNAEIGEKLFISRHTVKTHTHNLFKKIKASSRSQAALWAVKNL